MTHCGFYRRLCAELFLCSDFLESLLVAWLHRWILLPLDRARLAVSPSFQCVYGANQLLAAASYPAYVSDIDLPV